MVVENLFDLAASVLFAFPPLFLRDDAFNCKVQSVSMQTYLSMVLRF